VTATNPDQAVGIEHSRKRLGLLLAEAHSRRDAGDRGIAVHRSDEGRGILGDLLQMLARRLLQPDVVGRPAAAQGVGIGVELVERGDEKLEVAQEKPS
jgi:hypothetical protein